MLHLPTIESFENAIRTAASDRYLVEESKWNKDELLDEPYPADIMVKILRLKRLNNKLAGWKTIIIGIIGKIDAESLEFKGELRQILKISAHTREKLTEAEPYDLYLFLGVLNPPENDGPCMRLEATEQFCRKYVLRPNETIEDLIERTFLSRFENQKEKIEPLQDPLILALRETQSSSPEHFWLESRYQNMWKNALISGETADTLIEMLFEEIPQDSKNDE